MILLFQGTTPLNIAPIAALNQHWLQQNQPLFEMVVYPIYLVETQTELARSAIARLEDILEAKPTTVPSATATTALLWVLPRLGTISPWSSKATDIAHICGLHQVTRIEYGQQYQLTFAQPHNISLLFEIGPYLYDRMTQYVTDDLSQQLNGLSSPPQAVRFIPLLAQGKSILKQANQDLGLALSDQEIDYLYQAFVNLKRNPSDVELMMFAQVNSEHCRHKIFKAQWTLDNQVQPLTLFDMIKNTYQNNSAHIWSAYADNAAVIAGATTQRFFADPNTQHYGFQSSDLGILMKVETHNHPTAIAPFEGAATGQGGEIRDEGATGRGGKPKAGLTGFSVSHLCIPGYLQPWESQCVGYPTRIASALEIMLKAPLGGANYNNEFGRPNINGYFRTYEQQVNDQTFGYHKPIMLAGGFGNIDAQQVQKQNIPPGSLLIVLGGPAMRIGLGGGAASSVTSGQSDTALDFASVQRPNPEMERRCQEVIDGCWALDEQNPILSIHDVGAGGLCNALPELVHDHLRGARIELRKIPNAEPQMSPLEIWCNEAQERYVLAIQEDALATFTALANRERCPFAVVGEATLNQDLAVVDAHFKQSPVDVSMALMFDNSPQLAKTIAPYPGATDTLQFSLQQLSDYLEKILEFPAVADKSFLITIGDRSVGGLVCRDQMVGPWQLPIADCGVTAAGFAEFHGEALAMGERTPLAVINPSAAARMALGEALTNIAAADITELKQVRLSGNWMAAASDPQQAAALYEAVKAIGLELAPALDLTIPVGKDSLSMRTQWADQAVLAPLSLVISAFAPVKDVRHTLTPYLRPEPDSCLLYIDLANGLMRLGNSCLAQITNQLGSTTPDVETPAQLLSYFKVLQQLREQQQILAYHDRSDGGLWVTLCEYLFASRIGLEVNLGALTEDPTQWIPALFNEELGAVIQIYNADLSAVQTQFKEVGIATAKLATLNLAQDEIRLYHAKSTIYQQSRVSLQALWSRPGYEIQKLRDNSSCAQEAYLLQLSPENLGLRPHLSFTPTKIPRSLSFKPKVAILREQGVNGHLEMAAAFTQAGFLAIDVHMTDLIAQRQDLAQFQGLAVCGGFSYGDVLGAGQGWAKSILFHPRLRTMFEQFFARADTFSLGVCNGCQMLSGLKTLIPGAQHWPTFVRNRSNRFEARLAQVKIQPSPSILFKGMQGSQLPIVVSHGEGQVAFASEAAQQAVMAEQLVSLAYVNSAGEPTMTYPDNPNGSIHGITGLTSSDGRVTLIMPHPERTFRTVQFSWCPSTWQQSPWMNLFYNARNWLNQQ